MPKISFVIPCYRSENTIETVVQEIRERMEGLSRFSYDIILVNDYSPDGVWRVIERLCKENGDITGVNLARNFGQHSALLAGYAHITGDYVISLDDDGQAPLESIGDLIEKLEEGYDVVYAYYREIKQNLFRRFGSLMAKKMAQMMIGYPKDFKGSSFFIARKFVIEEIIRYPNSYPYLGGLVFRTTTNIACIPTDHRSRLQGRSGYTFRSLLSLWINGFTAFSVKPLEFSAYCGFFLAFLGFIYAIIIIVRRIQGITTVEGWSTIIALMLFIGGMIMIMLGLIGEYIGRIYISINNSPQYVVKAVIKGGEKDSAPLDGSIGPGNGAGASEKLTPDEGNNVEGESSAAEEYVIRKDT